ncbi:Asp-tRNA(Asn)/Glu-tRNA(Gln) amidotransferase GatCAB subunit B [Candidatus Campbellbacteria bacterium CG11_big_fil_rev_8_21_14_0_20_44_21]|uniref:Aspartyl/glutamyl-tRNA(Asn/Gln) amidotransferase subunit B n=1 Tax=Candidatus Campbellbacteria bacterium CG22_combo_CG10-13_8_21_14_all_43_18 TaxID=1974530 RepID=A0A2H0DWF6_9BACT|nr:MAG: Asp-tRNA(Asn)/Glu-tRNA(Gln) amidotransferase GatCAB subunit B [Candidatus Campbellbacteria bacterium CG22_combo_CG10-13_8_21_14_all_43_18]PIR24117.1 MAG: Asp-tRNA(Asn)/Glu-tRNA(Gln) amidotransferase GatCAB subunit B [Candidatus Campbellbacteria bacterium CG11_big_fil_rev_8_21_14_0_20_44_21]
MDKYKATIGLEIHTELKTRTKMFCNSRNDPDETEPNTNICPVCLGHPGTLPVINKEAVKSVLKIGLALGGKPADFSEFDRKNYFYPDIPKGYQISQYKHPLVSGGELNGVKITRIHLEEDTALLKHKDNYSLIDFNRSGIPLMELVTEPVIESAKEAAAFAKELQLVLRYTNLSEANMEKGEMRVEANISIMPTGLGKEKSPEFKITKFHPGKTKKYGKTLGVKTEIKNLNSFRVMEKAIEYEIKRQTELLERGEKVLQETRGWDDEKEMTFSQRIKEGSADYRYFPDPDLTKLKISEIEEFQPMHLAKEIPALPWEKRGDYLRTGIKAEDAEILVQNPILGDLFQKTVVDLGAPVLISANYIVSDLLGLAAAETKVKDFKFSLIGFSDLMKMIGRGEIGSRAAKNILKKMYEEGGKPREIAEKEGLYQKSDEAELKTLAEKIIKENSSVAEDYRRGTDGALQFLIGLGMKETRGSANPQVLNKIFKDLLG